MEYDKVCIVLDKKTETERAREAMVLRLSSSDALTNQAAMDGSDTTSSVAPQPAVGF